MGKKKICIIESEEGLPEGFSTQNLLKEPEKEKCSISEADLEVVKKNHALPLETVLFTHPSLTSECYSPEWVCLPEYPFTIGLKFPFPVLITRFFASTKLNYAQLMPQGWRCLQTLVRLRDEIGLVVDLEEFAYTTEIRGFGLGRFCFRVKSGGEPILISNNDPADWGWRNRFFFVRKDSLNQEAGVIQKWRSQEVAKLSVLFPEQADTEANVKRIFELDPAIRSFKAFPVLFSPERIEDESPAEPVKMSTATTRSKALVSTANLLAGAKARRSSRKDNKLPPPVSMASSSVSKNKDESKKRKLVESEDTDASDILDGEKTREKFVVVMKDFADKLSDIMTPIMDQVAILKIKATRSSVEAEEARKEVKVSAGEISKLKKEVKMQSNEVVKLRKELADVCAERMKENEAHVKELEAAREDFKFNATKALLKTRIQMMEELKSGQAVHCDLEEERKTLEDFISEPVDAEEVNSPALEELIEDANKVLSSMVGKQVEGDNQEKETDVTLTAVGQNVEKI